MSVYGYVHMSAGEQGCQNVRFPTAGIAAATRVMSCQSELYK